jgi:hypothetical protein
MTRVALVLLLSPLLAACVSDDVKETAETVLTLQSGTVSELRDRRGNGPFTTYDLAPEVMLGVVEAAARKARGADGEPVRAVFVSELRGEVVAKERAGEGAQDDGYTAPFRTAMLAVVHRVPGRGDQSRVEIHMIQRGPFHRGVVDWTRDMPGWIQAVLAERAAQEAAPLTPIP